MKYKGQGKKEYILLKFDDYSKEWVIYSNPVTINQAIWLMSDRPNTEFKIERIKNA